MKISQLIQDLESRLRTDGDIDVLIWQGHQPASDAPRLAVCEATLSSYLHILPTQVYGPAIPGENDMKKNVGRVLFITTRKLKEDR